MYFTLQSTISKVIVLSKFIFQISFNEFDADDSIDKVSHIREINVNLITNHQSCSIFKLLNE